MWNFLVLFMSSAWIGGGKWGLPLLFTMLVGTLLFFSVHTSIGRWGDFCLRLYRRSFVVVYFCFFPSVLWSGVCLNYLLWFTWTSEPSDTDYYLTFSFKVLRLYYCPCLKFKIFLVKLRCPTDIKFFF